MNLDERDTVATQFGVSPEQVERDHLISHLLAAIADRFADRVHFIGGTALARTHLPDGRLSEDIDLVALGNRNELAVELDAALERAVARTHGRLSWGPALAAVRDTEAANLRTRSGPTVKIQLLSSQHRTVWPAEPRRLEQRYSDAPPATLIVPTLPAFAASKTATWHDRRAPRDLWDLWALAAIGAIDVAAADLFRRHGPTNNPPGPYLFRTPPSESAWSSQLAAQTRLTISAVSALSTVRNAWVRVTDHEQGDQRTPRVTFEE
ncbi:nucleotidyltransferase AbiEii toxin of type IV toxin-antitoxin system [Rhodococcus sp. SMB37]|uniref:nucleotidyl transferase AbiEii/AbiGii toxin family protein n=1 Tax=Rhodococcus sp. SMB37 TaxID=2512213 RepID=UPI001052D4C6|nr:nucleotidyl transferase AbiEii/AbiGii toxin family protein [Rhodococcus sp. SMB37]TCN41410.1 nucleotidyltransferase AbiEii toxin of type IV toxin-antitoxin system [Rhodococcus sp. SMB37]